VAADRAQKKVVRNEKFSGDQRNKNK